MTKTIPSDARAFYTAHSALSDPGAYGTQFDALPDTVADLCGFVQNLLVHDYFGAHLYGPVPEAFHHASRQTLAVPLRLARLRPTPLSQTRAPRDRSVGTCRDFALLLCAVLRHTGIPARVRCGFARYFHPPSYEDHWICEYWQKDAHRWAIADAQLDAEHRAHLSVTFDITDVPRAAFVFPWQAWQLCRADPSRGPEFGHGETTGARFIHVNLARDLLTLLKQETSDWDRWREMGQTARPLSAAQLAQDDLLAALADTISAGDRIEAEEIATIQRDLRRPPWRT